MTIDDLTDAIELDGYSRHEGATLIAYRADDEFGLLRLDDADALAGRPAALVVAGAYDEVAAAFAELHIDMSLAMQEERPDGASFIAVDKVMYMLAAVADGSFAVLELTDFDFIEGEFAQVVYACNDLAEARGAFGLAVANRRRGGRPLAGRLGAAA
jgi:hypothetical protein